jgi:hypothetical protein
MKKGSTLFLRGAIVLIGLIVLGICTIALPLLIKAEINGADFDFGYLFIGLYISAIPFFIALYQSMLLLKYIDKNATFSDLGVQALKKIKYCGLSISGIFILGMPYIFYLAQLDDAPGLAALGLVIIFASFVIATFAGLLQKLLKNAIDIKSENELTV